MQKVNHKISFLPIILCTAVTIIFSSCKKFLDTGIPPTALSEDNIFLDSASATSAILALYSRPANSTPQNNSLVFNITRYGAMSADEAYYLSNATYDEFKNNTLAAGESVGLLWRDLYGQVYRANYAIRNLETSTLNPTLKNQLLGESKFWRAWSYFYLVNFFGDVPLVTTTKVSENSLTPKVPMAAVYQQMVADLTDAKSSLTNNYPSAERARVNKRVAAAFLARVFFYQQNWAAAEGEATEVISSGTYGLVTSSLDSIFKRTSNEIILQVANTTGVTSGGGEFIPASTSPNIVFYDTLVNTFEPNDKRKLSWTRSIVSGNRTYYYPYKYKIRTGTTGNEYHVMLRLAEMYLIRSEARANQNKTAEGVTDINLIRQRAGITLLPNTISKEGLLSALEHERWVELFTEWADRWFNLKRTGKADTVLRLIKPQWQPHQKLYPIPNTELQANPNLLNNPGY